MKSLADESLAKTGVEPQANFRTAAKQSNNSDKTHFEPTRRPLIRSVPTDHPGCWAMPYTGDPPSAFHTATLHCELLCCNLLPLRGWRDEVENGAFL